MVAYLTTTKVWLAIGLSIQRSSSVRDGDASFPCDDPVIVLLLRANPGKRYLVRAVFI